MAGGTSLWFSQDAKTDPREIFNGRLLFLLVTVAWAGCFYGFDSGNIGGILTLPSFEHAFGLAGLDAVELDARKVSVRVLHLSTLPDMTSNSFKGTIAAMLAAGVSDHPSRQSVFLKSSSCGD